MKLIAAGHPLQLLEECNNIYLLECGARRMLGCREALAKGCPSPRKLDGLGTVTLTTRRWYTNSWYMYKCLDRGGLVQGRETGQALAESIVQSAHIDGIRIGSLFH